MIDAPAHVDRSIVRVSTGSRVVDRDLLAAEEPLEIRLVWFEHGVERRDSIAVTMRTPGDDFELAIGFLHGEGIIASREDFVDVAYCMDDDSPQTFNVVTVTLDNGAEFELSRLNRHFYTTSSCGICGKATLEALDIRGCEPISGGPSIRSDIISSLPDSLLRSQESFQRTGGLHASGLFDSSGRLVSAKEDVGRHNALDKLIGEQVIAGSTILPVSVVMLSGRASFELLQKALMARVSVVAAVGAPSSLAVDLAREFNITLVGFVRPDGFNIYSAPDRVLTEHAHSIGDDAAISSSPA